MDFSGFHLDPRLRGDERNGKKMTCAQVLKDLNGGLFDENSKARMDTSPTHHIGARMEQVADALLKRNQFDQAEIGIIKIEKQIDIVRWSPLVSSGRAEQD